MKSSKPTPAFEAFTFKLSWSLSERESFFFRLLSTQSGVNVDLHRENFFSDLFDYANANLTHIRSSYQKLLWMVVELFFQIF